MEVQMVAVFQGPSTKGKNENRATRVLLADDHVVVRAGIRHLLNKAPDIHVIGEAGNGIEALRMVEELHPDVLLLDMEMPALNGIEVAQRLQEIGSLVRILVLSAYEDKQYILQLLQNGVSGYLTKDEVPEVIIDAVRGVSKGEMGWVSPRIAIQMARWNLPIDPKRQYTQIELNVLNLLAQGKLEEEISASLSLRQATVRRNVQTIFSKLGVNSAADAVVIAHKLGLID
jgi:DNA-binding NarL/FixJ family response regulator